jgi:hypothetical protein
MNRQIWVPRRSVARRAPGWAFPRLSPALTPGRRHLNPQVGSRLGGWASGNPGELPGGQLLGTRHHYCRWAGLAGDPRRALKNSPGLSAPALTRMVTVRPRSQPREQSEPHAPDLLRTGYFRAAGHPGEQQEKLIQARIGVRQVPFDFAKSPPSGQAQIHHDAAARAAEPDEPLRPLQMG